MKLWARVFLGYFLVVGIAGWFVLRVFINEVKPGVREAVEDVMVDSAHLIAEMAATDLRKGRIDKGLFAQRIDAYRHRQISASIWGREKHSLDFRVYVTDDKGIVRFDSQGEAVGADYSQWRDVARTLRGEYGARATRDQPDEESSSVLYVAAPVFDGPRIIGVATLAKPVAALTPIIARSERSVFRHGMLLLAATLLVGSGFTLWLTLSFARLVKYAHALGRGERAEPPSRGRDEIGVLAAALARMRAELDGRAYVERYVEHLTHEMKSPLAAIRGAAELLEAPLPAADQARFAGNISAQATRLQQMIDRLLRLAQLEQQTRLPEREMVALAPLWAEIEQGLAATAQARQVKFQSHIPPQAGLAGDRFMLRQAWSNLVENALAFSPHGGRIEVAVTAAPGGWEIQVTDQGPGIPDYALARIFERFFSLPRPDGSPKSTGLGLAYVRQVAQLHGGTIRLENLPGGGARACLFLPA